MSAKIIEMPKRNQTYWDALFDKFCSDIDKVVAAHYPAVSPSARTQSTDECAPGQGYVGEDGGYIPDWRDLEGLTDVLPEMEMWRDKGAK